MYVQRVGLSLSHFADILFGYILCMVIADDLFCCYIKT